MRRISGVLTMSIVVVLAGLAAGCSSGSGFTQTGSAGGTTGGGGSGGAADPTVTGRKLFDTDFESVCQGATQSRATAFDKAAPAHKVLYFATYKDSLIQSGTELPQDWQVTFDPNGDAYAAVDLVACATRTADQFVKDCDGYTKDDKPTQNIAKVHTATYQLSVHEATTGKELGSTVVQGTDVDCPLLLTFESDTDAVNYYAPPPKEPVIAFLKPFAQP